MSRNRKDFKTFYRFDGNGRIIPGSNILKKGYKPEEGTWQESSPYECCAPVSGEQYWALDSAAFVEVFNVGGDIISRTSLTKTDSEGNGYRLDTVVNEVEGTETPYFYITKESSSGEVIWQKILDYNPANPAAENKPFAALAVASDFVYFYAYFIYDTPGGPQDAFQVMKVSQTDGTVLEWSDSYRFTEIDANGGNVNFNNIIVDSNDNLTVLFTFNDSVTGDTYSAVVHHFSDDINNRIVWSLEPADFVQRYGTYSTGKLLEDDSILVSMNGENSGGDYEGIVSTIQFTSVPVPGIAVNTHFKMQSLEPLINLIGSDGDMYSIEKDNDGEYYFIPYPTAAVIKMNAAGDAYSWAYADTTGNYTLLDSDVDSAGNLYIAGMDFTTDDIALVAKITPDGTLEWAYSITNPDTGMIWDSYEGELPIICVENDIIYIISSGSSGNFPNSITTSTDLKLPTDRALTPGTYGSYEVADITAQFAGDFDYAPTTGPEAFTNPAIGAMSTPTLTLVDGPGIIVGFEDVNLPLTKTTLK